MQPYNSLKNIQMGRRKIEIKLIKNERLRNITYNKRKRGLLKKLVELSIICGISAKLEMKDSFGNVIVVDAKKEDEELKNQVPKDKVFVFTPADYPQFKGFQKIKKRSKIDYSEECDDESQAEVESSSPREERSGDEAPNVPIEQKQMTMNSNPQIDTLLNSSQLPIAQQEGIQANMSPVDYQLYLQGLQLRAQLNAVEMQYNLLLNSFMNGLL